MFRNLSWQWTVVWVSIYSIAMAFLESAVVIYLRAIYYPYGFDFPLAPIDKSFALVEIGREGATVLMLLAIGMIAGKSYLQRFAYFLYCFAIWDIFYYVFLYILIAWPGSLLTWDVLFLIPVAWVGPVIAPILIAITMIYLGLMIILGLEKNRPVKIKALPWIALIAGSLVLILSFTWDYASYLLEKYSYSELFRARNEESLYEALYSFIPRKFNWLLFATGELVIVFGIFFIANDRKENTEKNYKNIKV
jgi:hypothetical protein